jgi:hypothetical protein
MVLENQKLVRPDLNRADQKVPSISSRTWDGHRRRYYFPDHRREIRYAAIAYGCDHEQVVKAMIKFGSIALRNKLQHADNPGEGLNYAD